ncbi:MAG: hypothetical protein A3G45_00330 [Candidatus Staskawiczbacteria bacterium RIFCSPLOWO2_12_FULL_37_15]|uniref:DOD-type homing endonuclease domain-containing protein n=1 Tax=Candidatus Staskawiczbacteria bacterium RIFCSPLOWO2_12_FULL_37_15 TaxID=1802218 RepID=A0A1G2IQG5_9BACT|nr:MAG: hypothetical protein A3G45_00330 [Candidatus Staskawiczbacteria bacterium RIFCSPLOWO2_12_FULL_37_15]OHA25910.1 MAG: hypothetical protein A3D52_02945 [Candidatus Taylorbacteria bacterium RIFCSPHIGHO2_02_FULL_44_36]HXK41020.1 LAGLIDADG family homing endonuclease [Candidatus Paceibacterota bacterium]
MGRIKFTDNLEPFLEMVQDKTNLSMNQLANICGTNRRSFSDWKNNKYSMPQEIFNKLIRISKLDPPKFKILPDFWHIKEAAKRGAINRNRIYGNPGTSEGRSRGGIATCRKFRLNPLLAKKLGFGISKDIALPKKSSRLAELIGVLLGDGSISDYQVRVYHDSETDVEHAFYVADLFQELFSVNPTLSKIKNENTYCVVISSINLIDSLIKLGLKRGSKIRQGTDIPVWIKRKKEFLKACLRGLMDTDGCFYIDKHKINGRSYYSPCLVFTNHSPILLKSVLSSFQRFNYGPTLNRHKSIFIRRKENVIRYFSDIGSSNPKHVKKFRSYSKLCKN